ncbi:MAG TPA: MBL fold metallo-hydrolase [Rhizomicrobium sp.]|nr:MBL fold metallo-hydrolase [Rhizomicrobium sp.]
MAIPFVRDFDVPFETEMRLTPLIGRVLARNPGPFTFKGTGVYVVGGKEVAVIDPGPDIPEHVDALKRALEGKAVRHILVTHTHADHSPAAKHVKEWSGAKTYAFGPHGAGKAEEGVKIEEGGDMEFVPDVFVRDGETIEGPDYTFECVFTPGHTSNHMCFALKEEKALFTGDHVMGWSTTVVAPPDGDMAAYMASLRKLLARDDAILWPTHGGPVRDPKPFLEAYIAHRMAREAQIMASLKNGIRTIPDIVRQLYADVDPRLHPAAARSVLAHLIQMAAEGRVVEERREGATTHYRLIA